MNTESFTGYLGLIPYVATLLPSNIFTLFPILKKNPLKKFLLKYRREIGLTCFFFSVIHGVYVAHTHAIDFSQISSYTEYFTGLGSLIIFALLAATSNQWSMRKLRKNWKKLHSLTYAALVLLILHLLLVKRVWSIYTWSAFITLCLILGSWLFMKVNRAK